MGVAELGSEGGSLWDAVLMGLSLSELSDQERGFALSHIYRILKPGGLLLIADETVPKTTWKRWISRMVRACMSFLAILLVGGSTREVAHPERMLRKEGFEVLWIKRSCMETFFWLAARRPGEG